MTLITLVFFGCDDNTGSIGGNLMPDSDNITPKVKTFYATTQSILADSIYARTSTAYLGRYTDPDFGVFEADFLTQFSCPDNFTLGVPDSLLVDGYNLGLSIQYGRNDFYGDSLALNKLSVYELNKNLEDASKEYYYTNINPENYYNSATDYLASKFYTIKDMSVSDSVWDANWKNYATYSIFVPLPKALADRIVKANKEHPEYFENSETFINNVFKGVYVKHDSGDGNILYINGINLTLYASIYDTDSLGNIYRDEHGNYNKDSITTIFSTFNATKEVVQANRFQNSERLKELVAQRTYTYLKSPAGIFTEVTLPIDEITAEAYANDTINSVQLSLTAYNEVGNNLSPYKMPKPQNVLLLRKKDMYSFFEKNELNNNITSYRTTLGSNNLYKFSNINDLVITCINEKRQGEESDANWTHTNPDWNKVVIMPISLTTDSKGNVVDISHDLRLTSAKLEGGPEGESLSISVVYTTFGKSDY